MRIIILIIIALVISLITFAQEKKYILRAYISPTICKSHIQHRVFKNGAVTLTNQTKSTSLFWGGDFELLRALGKKWYISGDLAFMSKGYFATSDTTYNFGSYAGSAYGRTDLSFIETTISIEKQMLLNAPKCKILTSAGIFYGFPTPKIVGYDFELGNDFGTSLSLGVQKNHILGCLGYKKGLIKIDNNANSSFSTNILCIKLGYLF